jgi:hypothetical protein
MALRRRQRRKDRKPVREKRVLFVDDEEMVLRGLGRLLRLMYPKTVQLILSGLPTAI